MNDEKKFAQLAQRIYESGERRIKPTWPWVLVRVVPKEQKIGSIFIPDSAGSARQNKPLLEGIVLATWEPHWNCYRKPGQENTKREHWVESEFKIGDRVLYPHFAGLPVNFLDEKNYRLIREWTFDELGGVMCKVSYDGDTKVKEGLDMLFGNVYSVSLSGA